MQLTQQGTGMVTQTQELVTYLRNKLISKQDAMQYSNKPDELSNAIGAL
jgi:twitching motility protein PilT